MMRLTRTWFPLAATALTVSAACDRPGSADGVSARADTLVRQQKYSEAAAEYEKALASNADNAEANAGLGLIALREGRFTQAYHNLLKAAEGNASDLRRVGTGLATIDLFQSSPERAREHVSELAGDSATLPTLMVLATTSTTSPDVAAAIKKLEAAKSRFAADPRFAIALATLRAKTGHQPANGEQVPQMDGQSPLRDAADTVAESLVLLGKRRDAQTLLASRVSQDSSDTAALRLLAELALSNGDVQTADNAVRVLLSRDSMDIDSRVLRGRVYLQRGETAAALAELSAASKARPALAPIHYALATAYLRRSRTDTTRSAADSSRLFARRELERAVGLARNYSDAVLRLAELNIQVGNPRAAVGALEGFITRNPASTRARILLGSALASSGRQTEAIETLQQITARDSTNAEAQYWLSTVLMRAGKRPEATDALEAAARAAPGFAEAVSQLVLLDLGMNRGDAALARVQREIERAPRSGPLYDILGLVHSARNETDAAEAAFLKAVALEPGLVDAHVRLSELYMAEGKAEPAFTHADLAARLEPSNYRALMAMGTAAQQRGDAALARRAYERVLSLNPRLAEAANNLAYVLSEQLGDQATAFKYASLALESAPNDPHVMDTLGWILFKRGDLDRASRLLRASGIRLPDSPSVQYHLGMVAQRTGDTAVARQALTKAASSNLSFVGKEDARKALAQMR